MFPTFFLSFFLSFFPFLIEKKGIEKEKEKKKKKKKWTFQKRKNIYMSIIGPRYALSPNNLNQISVDVPLVCKQRITILSFFFYFHFLNEEKASLPAPQGGYFLPNSPKFDP